MAACVLCLFRPLRSEVLWCTKLSKWHSDPLKAVKVMNDFVIVFFWQSMANPQHASEDVFIRDIHDFLKANIVNAAHCKFKVGVKLAQGFVFSKK